MLQILDTVQCTVYIVQCTCVHVIHLDKHLVFTINIQPISHINSFFIQYLLYFRMHNYTLPHLSNWGSLQLIKFAAFFIVFARAI